MHIYKLGVNVGLPKPIEHGVIGAEVRVDGDVGVNELNALDLDIRVNMKISEGIPGELPLGESRWRA